MKTILSIGITQWVCPDATTPAKIAELIGSLKPVDKCFPANNGGGPVFRPRKYYGHEIKIEELREGMLLTEAQFKKWQMETLMPVEATKEVKP